MTNLIAFLHMTSAYQTAALQLMVGEANFAAEQLGIAERLPLQTNRLEIAEVGPSPRGVNGNGGHEQLYLQLRSWLFNVDSKKGLDEAAGSTHHESSRTFEVIQPN